MTCLTLAENKYGSSYMKTNVVKNDLSTFRSSATFGNASSYSLVSSVTNSASPPLHYSLQVTNVESELRG